MIMQNDELDEAIDVALEGAPRAAQLSEMVDTLRERRETLVHDLRIEKDPEKQRDLRRRINELDRQIASLSEQRAISHFIEMTVRASANRPQRDPDIDEVEVEVEDE